MYTINGKFIKSLPEPKKLEPIKKNKNKEKIIEHMDNSTASFNSLRFHDQERDPVNLSYLNDKVTLTKENKNNGFTTMLDVDFANDAISIYSNLTIENNLIFYPNTDEEKVNEINKGMIFYNKDKKIVGAIHKDSKDKSDIVFRSGYSDESAFGLTERLRINNSENRVSIKGAVDADQLCLGSTCITKADLDKIKKLS
jgi:hypothetical protein